MKKKPASGSKHTGSGQTKDAIASDLQNGPSGLDLSGNMDLVILSIQVAAARCRLLGSAHTLTLRAKCLWDHAPGEIIAVKPLKQRGDGDHLSLTGEIVATRIDAAVLALVPLGLTNRGVLPVERGAKVQAFGLKNAFEMEHLIPAIGPKGEILEGPQDAIDLACSGRFPEAHKLLMEVCQADLRCLDAHVQLGAMVARDLPGLPVRNFEIGVRIGELSLAPDFDGMLPWDLEGNRPFLRCMHGFGMYLWNQGRLQEAEEYLERMLRLDPTDKLDARYLLKEVRAKSPWYFPLGRG